MIILTPKRYLNLDEYLDQPLYFLAGPVRGGGDWQRYMAEWIERYDSDAIIVVPTRWDDTHPLARHFGGEDTGYFERQLDFERYYIEQAALEHPRGCLLFWLGEQKAPRPAEDGPYAQDTYGELGRWSVHKHYQPHLRLVIGAEPKFPGLDVIKRNVRKDVEYEFPFHESLEATARAAAHEADKNPA